MKLYFAGNVKGKDASEMDRSWGVSSRLLSYAFKDDWARAEFDFWVHASPPGVSVFLDSGAFSAHTRGTEISLDRYCDYVEQHRSALSCYAALDVIGDHRATAVNLRHMRDRGLDPVAVFHSGEPYELLDDICAGCGYVALGGMASDSPAREDLQRHLDKCFARIAKHWPIKVHGFGIMAQWALERYPFCSVDSSAAIVSAGMGRVVRFDDGRVGADGWADHARATFDGEVADYVSTLAAPKGSAHVGRRMRNVVAMLALERYVTDLWAQRGVTWPAA